MEKKKGLQTCNNFIVCNLRHGMMRWRWRDAHLSFSLLDGGKNKQKKVKKQFQLLNGRLVLLAAAWPALRSPQPNRHTVSSLLSRGECAGSKQLNEEAKKREENRGRSKKNFFCAQAELFLCFIVDPSTYTSNIHLRKSFKPTSDLSSSHGSFFRFFAFSIAREATTKCSNFK